MQLEETRSCKIYTATANGNTIRRAADSPIGENLSAATTDRPATSEKNTHPIARRRAFYTRMKKNNGQVSRRRHGIDYAMAAMEQMELYFEAHPGSPSAVRRPRLSVRGDLWIALLGPSVEEGIVGIGPTVTAALRAFDVQYLAGLRPPAKMTHDPRAGQRELSVPAT
jgi:hypothetical protein